MRRLLLAIALCASPALAHGQNFAPLPMGPRTGAMGGTGLAAGDDSAMGFLNPAGLSRVTRDTLAISLSAYALTGTRYRRFFADPEAGVFASAQFDVSGNELRQGALVAIPTALSYMLHFGEGESHHVLAFSVLTHQSSDLELEGALRADSPFARFDDRASLVVRFRTYNIGPSYALELKQDWGALRAGASVFVAYSTLTNNLGFETLTGTIPPTDFAQIQLARFATGSSFDLAAVAGAQLDVGPFSAGIAVHAPSLHLGGSFESRARQTRLANGAFDPMTQPSPDVLATAREVGAYEERHPLRLAGGLAFRAGDLLIAADASLTLGLGPYTQFDGDLEQTILTEGSAPQNTMVNNVISAETETVINFAVGLEYRVSPSFALRAGGFTDFSATKLPEDPSASQLFLTKIDRIGVTAGVAFGGKAASTTVAIGFINGSGTAIGLDVGNLERPEAGRRVDAVTTTIALFASGTVDVESMLSGI